MLTENIFITMPVKKSKKSISLLCFFPWDNVRAIWNIKSRDTRDISDENFTVTSAINLYAFIYNFQLNLSRNSEKKYFHKETHLEISIQLQVTCQKWHLHKLCGNPELDPKQFCAPTHALCDIFFHTLSWECYCWTCAAKFLSIFFPYGCEQKLRKQLRL